MSQSVAISNLQSAKRFVHNLNFVDVSGFPITALALTPGTVAKPQLACSRSSGSIEIYDVIDSGFALNRVIPGHKGGKMTKLAWTHHPMPDEDEPTPPRLFSVGLTGLVIEWDLVGLRPRQHSSSYGGGIWCLAPHPSEQVLAIGCEDGAIRLFNIEFNQLELMRIIPQDPHRVLSLAWCKDGKHIISGNDVCVIQKRNYSTGAAEMSTKVELNSKNASIPVWDLATLPDNTIISGDASGTLTLFDGDFGTVIARFKSHEADILCLAVNKAGTEIYSAGVDDRINRYTKNTSAAGAWSLQSCRRIHTHDTNALLFLESYEAAHLVSGGMDMRLSILNTTSFMDNSYAKTYDPISTPSPISLYPQSRLLMASYPDRVKIWRLGKVDELKTDLSCLTVLSDGPHNILHSVISPDGNWLALSDVDSIRLFRINYEKESMTMAIEPVSNFPPSGFMSECPHQLYSASQMTFLDEEELLVATTSGLLFVFSLSDHSTYQKIPSPFARKNNGTTKSRPMNIITYMTSNKVEISLRQSDSSLAFLSRSNGELKYPPMFIPKGSSLQHFPTGGCFVATPSWHFNHYGTGLTPRSAGQFYRKSTKYEAPKLAYLPPPKDQENQNPYVGGSVIPYKHDVFMVLKPFKIIPHEYDGLQFFGFLSEKEVVVVRYSHSEMMASLPPAFVSKKYTGNLINRKAY